MDWSHVGEVGRSCVRVESRGQNLVEGSSPIKSNVDVNVGEQRLGTSTFHHNLNIPELSLYMPPMGITSISPHPTLPVILCRAARCAQEGSKQSRAYSQRHPAETPVCISASGDETLLGQSIADCWGSQLQVAEDSSVSR